MLKIDIAEIERNKIKESHLSSVNEIICNYDLNNVMNSDQFGFNYEFYSTRILSNVGKKKILQLVQSVSNTTHSYTIQLIITAASRLLSPMLICLQEVTGNNFGPRIVMRLENASNNLIVRCSKSNKLTKAHVQEWASHCLTTKSLLFLDSWNGQDNEVVKNGLTKNYREELTVVTISLDTTDSYQRLLFPPM